MRYWGRGFGWYLLAWANLKSVKESWFCTFISKIDTYANSYISLRKIQIYAVKITFKAILNILPFLLNNTRMANKDNPFPLTVWIHWWWKHAHSNIVNSLLKKVRSTLLYFRILENRVLKFTRFIHNLRPCIRNYISREHKLDIVVCWQNF